MAPRRAADGDPPPWAVAYRAGDFPPFAYTADVLAFGVRPSAGALDVVTITRGPGGPYAGENAFPGGFVDWAGDVDAAAAAVRELAEETGIADPGLLETLDTYDANGRDPRQWAGTSSDGDWVRTGARVVSKAFIALMPPIRDALVPRPGEDATAAHWRSVYDFLPWEDLRDARGRALRRTLSQLAHEWAKDSRSAREREARRARVRSAFGTVDEWNEERAPERYRLLLAAGAVPEAHRDRWGRVRRAGAEGTGESLAFDHRAMLADALGRLRGKLKYVPAVFAALLGDVVSLPALQATCEAVAGRSVVTPNFRRVMTVTHELLTRRAGRATDRGTRKGAAPALYAFRSDVRSLRLDPAIRMPWSPLAQQR